MAKDHSDELYWRETYFIVFPRDRRPTLSQVKSALEDAHSDFSLENPAADPEGFFQSVLIQSEQDNAAVEVSFETGEAVIEQNLEWAKQLQKRLPAQHLQHLMTADSRLDVAHFERLSGTDGDAGPAAIGFGGEFGDEFGDDFDDPDPGLDMLDPTCLLTVVEALARLTDGLTFDPAAGELMD